MRRLLTILVPLLMLAVGVPPAAANDSRARELYEAGAVLYEEGDYRNAVVAWEEAWELSRRPLLLFNIANALERIGNLDEALESLNEYRAFADPDERETLDRRIWALERRIEEQRQKEEEAEAEVARVAREEEASRNKLTTRSTPAPLQKGPNGGGVIMLGAGLGGVGVGGLFGGLALSARREAGLLCSAGDPVLCPDTARDALQDDKTYSLVSDISMIAGGALAAAGVVILIIDAVGSPKKASAFRILPSAGPEGGSVTLVARW
jgi:tetratricopeptide (TPR) repeat protein